MMNYFLGKKTASLTFKRVFNHLQILNHNMLTISLDIGSDANL